MDHLRHNAKSSAFSGALSPLQASIALAALNAMECDTIPVSALRRATAHFHSVLRERGLDIGTTQTPMTPIMIADSGAAFDAADRCIKAGVQLLPISFPVVPLGKARLRATVAADHRLGDLTAAADVISTSVANAI